MQFSDLNSLDGLQFIPVNEYKVPIVKGWQTTSAKHDLSNCQNVGLVCGSVSGNLEALDFDLKYDITKTLYTRIKNTINRADPELLKKMVVQRTKNNGYHFLYRCSATSISGNQKLANRPTTDDERAFTFKENYDDAAKKGKNHDEATAIAKKAADNDKVRVLIETRGTGGQVVCYPSKGYELVFGDFYSINDITSDERECLLSICRSFNEVFEESVIPKHKVEKTDGKTTFDDYNERGDIVGLLQNHGWKVVNRKGSKIHMLRPGQTATQTSGNYDESNGWFSVFTTSTEFEPNKGYRPYAVFAKLECNGDFSVASRRLFEQGYGERKMSRAEQKQIDKKSLQRINEDDEDFSFVATRSDYDPYLKQVRDGTLPMGLTTGSPMLDEYFRLKEGTLVMTNGVDNTGKTVWFFWLLLIAAMYHGWTGIIFSSENTVGNFMRKMIQFYWGKPIRGDFAMTNAQYDIAYKFVEDHFTIINSQEDLYSYRDIIAMCKKVNKKKKHKYCFIDPYNSLKIDMKDFTKMSTHEFHYEALSEIKSFGQKNNFGWFVNHHAISAATRLLDGDKKYPVAPQKADTEGGAKVSNKADDFITVHRITQHPTEWMVTEVHVRKIKDTETGGKVTPKDQPVKFEMYKGGCGFRERLNEFCNNPIDPIEEWHKKQNGLTQTDLIVNENGALDYTNWTPLDPDEAPF